MSYKILHFYSPGAPEDKRTSITIQTGLTLEEAKAHCSLPSTSGGIDCPTCGLWSKTSKAHPLCSGTTTDAWFDGYAKED